MIIDQNTPPKHMFTQPEFFIKQINYKPIQTVAFFNFFSREMMEIHMFYEPIAVFKVKPRLLVSEAGELEAYEMQGI